MTFVRYHLYLLLLGALTSCGVEHREVEIRFAAHHNGQPLSCSATEGDYHLGDLRFYVSELGATRADGSTERLELTTGTLWQSGDVALLDLEDGSGHCQNGTAATNDTIRARVPVGDYRGLRFTLGVPEELNHGDPLIAEPPLTDTAMHWHWRSGYKFLRAGLQRGSERVRLHLGSAQCHGVIGNLQGCDASNRVQVSLPDFDIGKGVVVFDFAELLAPLGPQGNALLSCEMGPDEAACDAFRLSLGLDANGDSRKATDVFKAATAP